MTFKLLNATSFSHDKVNGSNATITIPATTAGSTLIITSSGAATNVAHLGSSGGTTFTKRSPTSLSTYELACQDLVDSSGGTTAIYMLFNASENTEGVIYEFASGALTFNSGLAHTTAGATTDRTFGVGGSLSPSGRAVVFQTYATNYATDANPNNKYWGMQPAGKQYYNAGNTGTGAKHWALHGISDVVAGTYTPLTSRIINSFGSSTQACAWFYDDSTSNPSYPDFANVIQKENSLPGVINGQWFFDRTVTAPGGIYGYTDKTSYLPGSTANFCVDSADAAFTTEIWRLGAYGHQSFGARRIQAATAGSPATQSASSIDGFGGSVCAWTTTATWAIPADACPGFYMAVVRLTATPTVHYFPIIFVVKSPKPATKNPNKILVKASDMTWAAYNVWGASSDTQGAFTGRSVYAINNISGSNTTRAFATSFDRPYSTLSENYKTFFFDAEFSLVYFLELCGYDIDYYSSVDIDVDPTIPSLYGTAVINGHDEYWTDNQRDAYENARDAGTNIFYTGGNAALWRVRFDVAGADPNRRKMICYKDSLNLVGYDGSTKYDPVSYTGTWRDTRNNGGGVNNTHRRPEIALIGQKFFDSGGNNAINMTVDSSVAALPCWRNTAVAALTGASTKTYGPYASTSILTYEIDAVDTSDPNSPPYLVKLSPQTITGLTSEADTNGVNYVGTGSVAWSMSLYVSKSGSLVFAAGTLRFLMPLVNFRLGKVTADTNEQDFHQFILNMLCDMGHTFPSLPDASALLTSATYTDPAPRRAVTAYGLPLRNYGVLPGSYL